MGKLRKFDIVTGILFGIATIILIYLFFNNLYVIIQELLSLFFAYLRVCSGFQSQIQLILKLRNF